MERQMHFLQSGLQRAEESIFPFVLILNSLILIFIASVRLYCFDDIFEDIFDDFEDFFSGGSGGFELDTTRIGIDVKNLAETGKEILKSFHKRDSDEKIIENFDKEKVNNKSERKESNVEELRKTIEQHKKEVLERRQEEKNRENKEKMREQIREKIRENKAIVMQAHSSRER